MIDKVNNLLIIIDGSSYLYRAYYALPFLTNSVGESTGAIYGVLNMIRNLIKRYHPTYVAVVFDTKTPNFRNKLFKYYKSNRKSMPDNLISQIKPLFSAIKAMGLLLIAIPGVEADDIIGTIAHKIERVGIRVLISTDDKDMAQLVTHNINIIGISNNVILHPKTVLIKYGVPPNMIVDLLSLMGDPSDNIPGIPGIGKKTAQILLSKIGKLDLIYSRLNEITNRIIRNPNSVILKLVNNKDSAYLSYQLASIETNIKLDITNKDLLIKRSSNKELIKLFKKCNFRLWENEIINNKWF